MKDNYIGYYFKVSQIYPAVEILIAELSERGFETFLENENGFDAFIQKKDWHKSILDDIYILNSKEFEISYSQKEIPSVNWNKEWEEHFKPIIVDNKVAIRAPFHKPFSLKYELIIQPKMSFGTGHHETTHMMIQHLLNFDLKNKKVLDMGCGTGILAIFAEKKGAQAIDAIDIDEWSFQNTQENIEANNCNYINVYKGGRELLDGKMYDVIIANINRNVLLDQLNSYAACLSKGGVLFLSGFYKEDVPVLKNCANQFNLEVVEKLERNQWTSLKLMFR